MNQAARIFISYRRSDAAGHARSLHEYLCGRFGDDRIFFDRSTIEGGDIFPDALRRGVEGCVALIALIAPDWLDTKAADGSCRLDDPNDFVRQEIALALDRGKKVIPVLFDDTPVPPPDRLPAPLEALPNCDALTLRGKTYEYDSQRRELVRLLAKVPGVPQPMPEAGEALASGIAHQLPAIIRAATDGLQQVTDAQRDTIRTLERQLGANQAQLAAFFQIIGEAQVPQEQQPTRLVEIAAQVRQLRAQVAPNPADLPDVALLKEAARAAVDAGRFEDADRILAQVEAAQDSILDQRQREIERQQMERAATAAQRGGNALTRLRYREAAQHFAAAARRVPPGREEQVLAYLDREAGALFRLGEEFGDNAALVDAIARYRVLLDRRPRTRAPLAWAMSHNELGNALARLGERESGTGRLEEAVAAYRGAFEERTRERVPLDWAMTQSNLGNALVILGERESGTARLEEAVAACREALKEWTRERVPLDWAVTQNNLGNALLRLGERESGTARLEEAVAAYREALEERTRERVPLDWAMTQSNLSLALTRFGERGSPQRLEEAVEACHEALKEWTRERIPLRWATTQNNLGNALLRLGERESDTGRLEQAVAAYREALKERTRERAPLDWAMTQTNLSLALTMLGRQESSTLRLEEAVAACREALKERTRERVPLDWAATQNNLGNALLALGERESDTGRLEGAVAAYREALGEYSRERAPLDWAMTQNNLGYALLRLGEQESGTGRLEEAVAACREALKEYTSERVLLQWGMTQNNLGTALWRLGERTGDRSRLREARRVTEALFEVFMQTGQEQYRAYFEERLSMIDRTIADLAPRSGA